MKFDWFDYKHIVFITYKAYNKAYNISVYITKQRKSNAQQLFQQSMAIYGWIQAYRLELNFVSASPEMARLEHGLNTT